ncbi:MAG TPA: phage minor head protein, partial [Pseudonocardiaceae bacterium]
MSITLSAHRAEFAAGRRRILTDADNTLLPPVRRALAHYGEPDWYDPILIAAERVFRKTFRDEAGTNRHPNLADALDGFRTALTGSLRQTHQPTTATADLIARWVATAAVNAATVFATTIDDVDLGKEWVTQHDDRVRHTHQQVDGQTVPVHEPFSVAGVKVDYPGQPVGPIDIWINCRCLARPTDLAAAQGGTVTAAAPEQTEVEPDESLHLTPVPWHGVLAPEGVNSGDRRKFAADALRWRDLPLPLSWQTVSDEGHKGSVVVGRIDSIYREAGLIKADGVWDQSPQADEALRQVIDAMLRGVSVDVDDATMELQNEDGSAFAEDDATERPITVFTDGRICGATLVSIPAFQEAFITVGTPDALHAAGGVHEGKWDGSAGNYTPEQYKRACILHRDNSLNKDSHSLPIRTPDGQLSRAGVH